MKWRNTKKAAKAELKNMRAARDVDAFMVASKRAAAACDAAAECLAAAPAGAKLTICGDEWALEVPVKWEPGPGWDSLMDSLKVGADG